MFDGIYLNSYIEQSLNHLLFNNSSNMMTRINNTQNENDINKKYYTLDQIYIFKIGRK